MITPRRSAERGHADHGWLNARHTFSFAAYHDPRFIQFGPMRVLNEDRIRGGTGFPEHPHHDMEIVTYVINGAVRHEDDMGNVSIVRAGEVQLMSAGRGVVHSEHNARHDEELHLLQMWVSPSERGTEPHYAQRFVDFDDGASGFRLIVAPDGAEEALPIGQDARLFAARMEPGAVIKREIRNGTSAWIQMIHGSIKTNDLTLGAGDGAAIVDEPLSIHALEPTECVLWHFGPDAR